MSQLIVAIRAFHRLNGFIVARPRSGCKIGNAGRRYWKKR
jgi:hypothetical protein